MQEPTIPWLRSHFGNAHPNMVAKLRAHAFLTSTEPHLQLGWYPQKVMVLPQWIKLIF